MQLVTIMRPGAACTALLAALFAFFLLLPAQAVTIERVISPGGIEAWLVADDTVPLIAMNFSFDGGTVQDPDGKEGLTRLLTASLDEGAGELTSAEYKARLEELAVSIGFSADRDHLYGSLRTLTATRDDAFALLRLALTEPRFDETDMERNRARLIAGVRRQEQDPNALAGRAFVEALFGDHPYARPSGGTEDSLNALNRDDIRAQMNRVMSKDSLVIGVVGAIDADTLAPLLDDIFGGLPATGKLTPVDDIDPVSGERISLSLDIPQTSILLGLPGLKRTDPDYQAAFVMNHILGGGSFTSWLYKEVREKRGLSYSVGTSLGPYEHAGLLSGSAATRPDRAGQTVEIMLAQLERMATDGPTLEELNGAKRFLTGSYALRFDTSGKIASQLVALKNAGLGIDYFDRRNAEIEAVTLEDVTRVAQRLLKDVAPTIVTIGPSGETATQ